MCEINQSFSITGNILHRVADVQSDWLGETLQNLTGIYPSHTHLHAHTCTLIYTHTPIQRESNTGTHTHTN